MADQINPVNDSLAVAGQVTPEQLQQAAQAGFKSVLNLRSPAEQNFPETEQQQVEALGLTYVNAPLNPNDATIEQLSQILADLEQLPKPSLIHCAGGMRASAIALLSLASQENLTAEQAIERARELGYDYNVNPKLKQFFENYIAAQTSSNE
jgi:uncharacterized protein (TIGR01244 family)